MLGRNVRCLLPKQDGGTSHIQVNPTKVSKKMVTLLLVVKSNICLRKADDTKERSAFHKIYQFEHRLHIKLQALLDFVTI